jgi:lipopolysaccharide/colanic/teichoic acid biosynthesis glycosyltransferase
VYVRQGTRLRDGSMVALRQFRTWDGNSKQDTKLGRLLRRYSLQYLPALINVMGFRIRYGDLLDLN